MSDTTAPENTTSNAAGAPKKGRKLMLIVISVLVLAAAGGGGYFYLQYSKASAKTATEKGKKATDKAQTEEEADEGAAAEEESAANEASKKSKPKATDLVLPDDSAVKQVIELQPYVVNLADQGEARYLRLTISLGIGGEEAEAEAKPSALFTTRVRNAMLAVLATRTSAEVLSLEGKAKLRKDLLRAARAASAEPKVEAIYITEFIVQL